MSRRFNGPGSQWTVPRMWEGGRCFVLGGGPSLVSQFDIPPEVVDGVRDGSLEPSAYSPYMGALHAEHVIGVNNAYLLGDWLDMCIFGDWNWWVVHRPLFSQWPNLRVTCCPKFEDQALCSREGIKYLARDRDHKLGLSQNPRRLTWGGNTGAAAVNLAVHLGARQVILLGFDMGHENRGPTHWHKGHGHEKRQAFELFMRTFPVMAREALSLGIEIINASPGTAIRDFPVVELREVL